MNDGTHKRRNKCWCKPELTSQQKDLVSSVFPMAFYLARFYCPSDLRLREYYLDAAISGFVKAARDFPSGNFLAFARRYAKGEMSDARKYIGRMKRSAKREVGSLDIGHLGELYAFVPPRLPDDDVDFEGWLSVLSDVEKEVVRLRFRDGLGIREIGHNLGFSHEKARYVLSHALQKIRDSKLFSYSI